MVRIPVFDYVVAGTGREIHIPSLRETPGTAGGGRRLGVIVAPEGSELYQSKVATEPPKIKVPKVRAGEFWLLGASDAKAAAAAGEHGLRWEPEPESASNRPRGVVRRRQYTREDSNL